MSDIRGRLRRSSRPGGTRWLFFLWTGHVSSAGQTSSVRPTSIACKSTSVSTIFDYLNQFECRFDVLRKASGILVCFLCFACAFLLSYHVASGVTAVVGKVPF